jgi:hypothetical protein
MRLSGKPQGAWPVLLILLVVQVSLLTALLGSRASAASDPDGLEVKSESGGGVRATAHPLFPAKPEVIQGLLSDYAHWPELFEVRMRVAELNIQDGVATVDLRIDHPAMPGERRLVTESKVLPNGGLVTDLKGGDFKRYHRVWKLQSAGDGDQTRAEFELSVEPDSIAPDWLLVMVVRQELVTHFRIVKQKALEHSKR